VAELAQQQERLATYRIQARYELATILDRAANRLRRRARRARPCRPNRPPNSAERHRSNRRRAKPAAATGSPQGEEPVEEPKP